jgi:response regulator RpfG family c-di-GMP phosphodiesterase
MSTSSTPPPPSSAAPSSKVGILYLGVESRQNTQLKKLVAKRGLGIEIVEDMLKACELAEQSRFKIAFIEESGRIKDGPAATSHLKSLNEGMTIIAVVDHPDDDLYARYIAAGVTLFIVHPAPVRLFISHIKSVFQNMKDKVQLKKLLTESDNAPNKSEIPAEIETKGVVNNEALQSIVLGVMDLFDKELGDHCQRVGDMCRSFAVHMKFSAEVSDALEMAGIIHDVGQLKVGTSLFKRDHRKYTKEQQLSVQQHVEHSETVVNSKELTQIKKMIRHHHEYFDGSGYPDALAGDLIPLGSRILAVIDAWDEFQFGWIHSDTPDQQVHDFLKINTHTRFDPKVVNAFIEFMATKPKQKDRKRRLHATQLKEGMVVARDIIDEKGVVLVKQGQSLNDAALNYIHTIEKSQGLAEDVVVYKQLTQAFELTEEMKKQLSDAGLTKDYE